MPIEHNPILGYGRAIGNWFLNPPRGQRDSGNSSDFTDAQGAAT
jgi:hypothetical protein